jgi:glycosyltransferase involved in cell wall biosynthesis
MLAAVHILTEALRKRRIEIVHTNSYHDRTIGAFAARRIRAGCVASVHSCFSIQHNLTHWYRNRYLIHHFTPDGYSTKEILVRKDGIPADRITVVHNALPPGAYVRSDADRARIRAEFSIPADAILIGNVGTMVPFKGQTHLLGAMAQLRDSARDVRCMIVGDGELASSLRDQAREHGLADRVVFAGHRTDLSALYSAFDIFSLPSLDFGGETYPLVVLTALAACLPVVASDVGDVAYMVRDGYNGFLTRPGDAAGHAAALRSLIDDDALRAGMGALSKRKSEEDHSIETMVGQFEQIYSRITRA